MGNLMDGFNQMIIEELIQGALGHIEDKEMVKEKADEFLGFLDKLDNDALVILTRLNGKVNLYIGKKEHIDWNIESPSFIDIETILRSAADKL